MNLPDKFRQNTDLPKGAANKPSFFFISCTFFINDKPQIMKEDFRKFVTKFFEI
jgi:hypothetical protein